MVGIKNFELPHNCYECDLNNYHECDLTCESIEEDYCWNGDSREKHCPLVEAIPKDQYEARLKADIVSVLEDLKQDFIAEAYGIEMDCTDYVVNVADIDRVIQQKINELKENTSELNEKTSN